MVGLKHLLFNKSLRELSLFSLEEIWPWRDLPADPSATGNHSGDTARLCWKDEIQKIKIEIREVHLNVRRSFPP